MANKKTRTTSHGKTGRITENFCDAKCDFKRVYLEDRYDKPKHIFIVIADKIASLEKTKNSLDLLDVGGATGEFVYYLKSRFPEANIICLEYDKKLYKVGKMKVKDCYFINGDANNMYMLPDKNFDVVTMIGVVSVFDDFVPSLDECIRTTRNGGVVYVFMPCNEFPIDILLRWRRSKDKDEYEKGLNIFSKQSVSDHLNSNKRVKSWDFEKFTLPFDLPRQDDILRTWTEKDRDGTRIFKNGLGMEINLQILSIYLK